MPFKESLWTAAPTLWFKLKPYPFGIFEPADELEGMYMFPISLVRTLR